MIDNRRRVKELDKSQYMQLFGVSKEVFFKMYRELLRSYRKLHARGGRPPKLSVIDKLIITLMYWREYRTYRQIAWDYGVGKSAIGNRIIWVEDTLIKMDFFSLPGKKIMQKADTSIGVVLIFANAADNTVIAIATHKGSVHDFRMFKENFEGANNKIKFLADSGFQRILGFHLNSETPLNVSKFRLTYIITSV